MTWDASKSAGDLITSSDWNDMVTDQKNHSSRHGSSGSDTIDAADLGGSSGQSGQLLQTDGSVASWVDFSSGAAVSDDGTQVLAEPNDVNYAKNLSVSDDGDGSVTVENTGPTFDGGTSTKSGDGSTTSFTISHGLGVVPDGVDVEPTSEDASADFWITGVTSADFTITYDAAPPSGTGNLTYRYLAATNSSSASNTTTRPSVSDNASVVVDSPTDLNFDAGANVADDGDGTVTISTEQLSYETGHTEWADGLSTEEVYRVDLQSGEVLHLDRVEAQFKGGGSSTGFTVDVYDATNSTVIDSADAGSVSRDGGSSGTGNTVLVRVSNSTGSTQNANLVVRGVIT